MYLSNWRQKLLLLLLGLLSYSFLAAQSNWVSRIQAGEELEYLVHYGWINGGKAKLTLEKTTLKGRDVYHAKAVGRTIGLADRLFRVYDVYESYFDPDTKLPVKAIRNVREGRYRRYNEVFFNHDEHSLRSMRSGKKAYPDSLKRYLFDILSAFYYARDHKFNTISRDRIITLDTYFTDKFWPLTIRFTGYETVKTKLGKIPCFRFSPVVEPGRVFESKDDVSIYISRDQNRVPISVKMDIIVGSFKTDLIDYSGLKYPLKTVDD